MFYTILLLSTAWAPNLSVA